MTSRQTNVGQGGRTSDSRFRLEERHHCVTYRNAVTGASIHLSVYAEAQDVARLAADVFEQVTGASPRALGFELESTQ